MPRLAVLIFCLVDGFNLDPEGAHLSFGPDLIGSFGSEIEFHKLTRNQK